MSGLSLPGVNDAMPNLRDGPVDVSWNPFLKNSYKLNDWQGCPKRNPVALRNPVAIFVSIFFVSIFVSFFCLDGRSHWS